jgi:hypothetical protein
MHEDRELELFAQQFIDSDDDKPHPYAFTDEDTDDESSPSVAALSPPPPPAIETPDLELPSPIRTMRHTASPLHILPAFKLHMQANANPPPTTAALPPPINTDHAVRSSRKRYLTTFPEKMVTRSQTRIRLGAS